MAPSSQESEPPGNPGRFTLYKERGHYDEAKRFSKEALEGRRAALETTTFPRSSHSRHRSRGVRSTISAPGGRPFFSERTWVGITTLRLQAHSTSRRPSGPRVRGI